MTEPQQPGEMDMSSSHGGTNYVRLLDALSELAQTLGTARDQHTVFRALRDFAVTSIPCIGIFIALYDPQRDVRIAVYGWGEGEEIDVRQLPPMPITERGPNSRVVRTGQIIITDNYMDVVNVDISIAVGAHAELRPQSSLAAPMSIMGRIVGTVEVQSYERAAYTNEHVTAIRMAANLAAVSIENMQLLEQESTARAVAEESNRLKDEFLATLSHELRTPLTAILGWTHLLRSNSLDEQTTGRAIETIERNARSQAQLIDDLLDVSRIITGNLRLNVQRVELAKIIDVAIEAISPAAAAKSIQLDVETDREACTVAGDAGRLQQVVWNLLTNAVKFTPQGGRVGVSLSRVASQAQLVVSDTGQGIPQEFLPYVFDRFRQADSAASRRHGGLGLGLSIVRHLVEMHGGTVEVESVGDGHGSTFTVRLSVVHAHDSRLTTQSTHSTVADEKKTSSARINLNGVRLLVVDDESDAREMLSAMLGGFGAEIKLASSTRAALDILEQWRPDVLISDIGMPEEDGYVLIQQIRALEAALGNRDMLAAVALTAYARAEDRARALAAGYHVHVAKPVEPSALVDAIRNLLDSKEK